MLSFLSLINLVCGWQAVVDVFRSAAEGLQRAAQHGADRAAERGVGVAARLHDDEVRLAGHQQHPVGLHRAGEVDQLAFAVREVGLAEGGRVHAKALS